MRSAQADLKHYDFIDAKAESVIHIYLPEGWITRYPGIRNRTAHRVSGRDGDRKNQSGDCFGESLKNLAGISDKLAVIRSMTHGEAAHERGTHNMFTGYKPSPAIIFPSFGSVVSHEYGPRNNLPPYVAIPRVANEYAASGYLSTSYGPFSLGRILPVLGSAFRT